MGKQHAPNEKESRRMSDMGDKIKALAKTLAIIGMVGAIIIGVILIARGIDLLALSDSDQATLGTTDIIFGITVMVGGALLAWMSYLALYGFGEVVDKITCIEADINEMLKYIKRNSNRHPAEVFEADRKAV